jgi:hypothetical protein
MALLLQKLPGGLRSPKCLRNADLMWRHPERAVILVAIPSLDNLSLILGLQDIPEVVRWEGWFGLKVALHWNQLDG